MRRSTYQDGEPKKCWKNELGLIDYDWHWATWRHKNSHNDINDNFEANTLAPFDLQQCMKQFSQMDVYKKDNYWNIFDWRTANIPDQMTSEEAHFWFTAMRYPNRSRTELRALLKNTDFTGIITFEEALSITQSDRISPWIMKPLFTLFDIETFIALVTTKIARHDGTDYFWAFVRGLQHVIPNIADHKLAELKNNLRPQITADQWPVGDLHTTHKFVLAAVLGMSDELLSVVESWDDTLYADKESQLEHYHKPQEIIFGLKEPHLINFHMRRLNLSLNKADYIRAWLAHTETEHLDWVELSLCEETNRAMAEYFFSALLPINVPEIAPVVFSLSKNSKASKPAKQWMEDNPALTIEGLAPLLLEEQHKTQKEEILNLFRIFKRKNLIGSLVRLLPALSDSSRVYLKENIIDYKDPLDNPLTSENTPAWLQEGLQNAGGPKSIPWISPLELPPILLNEYALNTAQITNLLYMLKTPSNRENIQLFDQLKTSCNGKSVESFAWALFEAWLAIGAPAKEKWAMLALGYLGNDETALKLSPMIMRWPGESQHQRAVTGLEVLRQIGSNIALIQLNSISQKVKFKGIKGWAQKHMESIAEEKGISKEELETRVAVC